MKKPLYLLVALAMIATMRFPLKAGRAATCMAAHIAAPLLIPAMMPS